MGWYDVQKQYENESVDLEPGHYYFDNRSGQTPINRLSELYGVFKFTIYPLSVKYGVNNGRIYVDDNKAFVMENTELSFAFDEVTTSYIIKCGGETEKKIILNRANNKLVAGTYKIIEVTRVTDVRNTYRWHNEPLLGGAGVLRLWDGSDIKKSKLSSSNTVIDHSNNSSPDNPTKDRSYNENFKYYTIPNFLIGDKAIGAWGYLGKTREQDSNDNYLFDKDINYGGEVGTDNDSIKPWYYSTYPTVVYDGLVENPSSSHNTGLVQRVDEGLWQINGNDGGRSIVQTNKIDMLCFERGEWTKDTDEYNYTDYFDNYHFGDTRLNWWIASKIQLNYNFSFTGKLPLIKGQKSVVDNYYFSSLLDTDLNNVNSDFLNKILYKTTNTFYTLKPTTYGRYPYYFESSLYSLTRYDNKSTTTESKSLSSIIPLTGDETGGKTATRDFDKLYEETGTGTTYEKNTGETSNTMPFLWARVNKSNPNNTSAFYSQLGFTVKIDVKNNTYDWFFTNKNNQYNRAIDFISPGDFSFNNKIVTSTLNVREIQLKSEITANDNLQIKNNFWGQQKTYIFTTDNSFTSGKVENSGKEDHIDSIECEKEKITFNYMVSDDHYKQPFTHDFKLNNFQIELQNDADSNPYMRAFIVDDGEPTVWFKQTLDTRQNPPAPAYEVYYGNNLMQKGTINLTLYTYDSKEESIELTINSPTDSASKIIEIDGITYGTIYWDGPGRSDSTKGCIVFEKNGDSRGAWSGFGANSVDLTKNDLNIDISTLSDSGVTYKVSIHEYGQPITLTATSDGYIPYVPNSGWSVGGTIHAWVYTKETNLVTGADWQYEPTNNIIKYKGNRPHI